MGTDRIGPATVRGFIGGSWRLFDGVGGRGTQGNAWDVTRAAQPSVPDGTRGPLRMMKAVDEPGRERVFSGMYRHRPGIPASRMRCGGRATRIEPGAPARAGSPTDEQ
jgi:hypothetical protein